MGNKGKKIQTTKPQEASIRKSLQDIVDTLRSHERDQVSNKGIEGVATCLRIHRLIITNLIILAVVFLLIFFIYH